MPAPRPVDRALAPRRNALARMAAGVAALGAGATWPARPTPAQTLPGTPPPEVLALWPQARLQGQATFRWLGLAVYDMALWAPAPVQAERFAQQTLALVLTYRLSLSGARIAERSVSEMARAGPQAETDSQRWLAMLRQLIPDVTEGQRLTGSLLEAGQKARFWHQGQPRGDAEDAEFCRRFFGIWLAPHTSEPVLRRQLLGPGA